VLELGLGAAEALSVPGPGRVIGAYRRAAYLDVPGGLFALTAPDVPRGPLHARTEAPPDRLRVDDPVVVTPAHLQAGPLLFDLQHARRWQGPVPSPAALDHAAPLALDLLASAPASSLPIPVPTDLLARGDIDAAAAYLGGVGPGLTPAGDDCLAGIFLVARIRWGEAAADGLVSAATAVQTNDVARAFLVWAARGQSIEPVHDFFSAAIDGHRDQAVRALGALTGWGHSSGADLALGLRLGLELLPATRNVRFYTSAAPRPGRPTPAELRIYTPICLVGRPNRA